MSDERVGPGVIRPSDESQFPAFVPKITRDVASAVSLKAEFDAIVGVPVDQRAPNNCVTNQLAIMVQHLRHKQGLTDNWLPSRMFPWWNTRWEEGGKTKIHQNAGIAVASAIASATHTGLCPESYCAYTKQHWYSGPNDAAYKEAEKHKIIEASCLTVKRTPDGGSYVIEDMENCIASGHSFIFGIVYYDNMHTDEAGVLPMVPAALLGKVYDSHALTAFEYNRTTQLFRCRNCKGPNWGYIKGDVLIPYAVMKEPLMVFDAWTATSISG